jgi:hypothetical protein
MGIIAVLSAVSTAVVSRPYGGLVHHKPPAYGAWEFITPGSFLIPRGLPKAIPLIKNNRGWWGGVIIVADDGAIW